MVSQTKTQGEKEGEKEEGEVGKGKRKGKNYKHEKKNYKLNFIKINNVCTAKEDIKRIEATHRIRRTAGSGGAHL